MLDARHIYCLNKDGLIYNTKFMQPLNENINIGDNLKNFYNEEVEFFNFQNVYNKEGKEVFLFNNKIKEISDIERVSFIKENAEILLNTLYNFENEFLDNSFRDDASVIKTLEYNFKDVLGLYEEPFSMKYSKSKLSEKENIDLLKKSYNNLSFILNDKNKPYGLSMERSVLNGTLTYIVDLLEIKINLEEPSNLLKEMNEKEEKYLDTSSGYSKLMNSTFNFKNRDLYMDLQNDKEITRNKTKGLKNGK